jgi:Skp family chaperone for outer membrane proteins
MKRWSAFVAVVVAVVSVAFVAGASVAPERAKPAEEKKPGTFTIHKTAVFNMAAVMRDFHQAKYQVWQLNNKRTELSKKLVKLREEYIQLQQELQKHPDDPKGDKAKRMLALARQVEDQDREINKQLNDDASAIIADLYDMIKAAVDRTAEENGFQLVFAYPDAVTADELRSPYIKELKLKPPAAQPFYVSPDIDITARVVAALNEKHPAIDPETKKPVDVSKLDVVNPGVLPKGPPIPLPSVPAPKSRP